MRMRKGEMVIVVRDETQRAAFAKSGWVEAPNPETPSKSQKPKVPKEVNKDV